MKHMNLGEHSKGYYEHNKEVIESIIKSNFKNKKTTMNLKPTEIEMLSVNESLCDIAEAINREPINTDEKKRIKTTIMNQLDTMIDKYFRV